MESVKYSASEFAGWTSAAWIHADTNFPIRGVSHDTRTLQPGDVYLAVKGDVHDGHQFVHAAIDKGAVGLIVDHALPEWSETPQLVVPDTLAALRDLAAGVRSRWTGTVIGITGSVGKTTVKELIAAVLSQKGGVSKTPGNWNNEIGLPLSMLAADRNADFLVFELGMSHSGEIDQLASLLKPDWAVLTDIGPVHIEFFESLEKIAEEKASLLKHAGHALLDRTSDWFDLFCLAASGQVVPFGDEPFEFTLLYPGKHMVSNARRAVAIGRSMGLTDAQIQSGLNEFKPVAMRWERTMHKGVVFINDAYNANPLSMRAALSTFAELPCEGRRVAVLGAMRELGGRSEEEHRSLGNFVNALYLDEVLTVGEAGKQIVCYGQSGLKKEEAVDFLRERLRPGDMVLFKASRGEHLETVLEELKRKI